MACVRCCSPSKGSVLRCLRTVLQLAHFLVALSLLCVAVVEFSAEAPLFDVLGTDRQAIPQPVFPGQVSTVLLHSMTCGESEPTVVGLPHQSTVCDHTPFPDLVLFESFTLALKTGFKSVYI